jgi:hypothetical protein
LLGAVLSGVTMADIVDTNPDLGTWSNGHKAFATAKGMPNSDLNGFTSPVFHYSGKLFSFSFLNPAVALLPGPSISVLSSSSARATADGVMALSGTPTCSQDVGHLSGFASGYVQTTGDQKAEIGYDGTSPGDCSGGVHPDAFDSFADATTLPGDIYFQGPSGPGDTDWCVAVGVGNGDFGNFPAYGQLWHFNFHYTDNDGEPQYEGCSVTQAR